MAAIIGGAIVGGSMLSAQGGKRSAEKAAKQQKLMAERMKQESDLYRGVYRSVTQTYVDPVTGKTKKYKTLVNVSGDDGYAGQNRDFYEGLAKTGEEKYKALGDTSYADYESLAKTIGANYETLATGMSGRAQNLGDDVLGKYNTLAGNTLSQYNSLAGSTERGYSQAGVDSYNRYYDQAAQGLRTTGYAGMMGILNSPSGVRNDAAYQFMQNEAETATSRAAGARGMGNSSNVLN